MAEFRFSEEPSLGAVVNPSYKVFCNWSPKTPIKSVYKITRDVCGHKFSTICGFTFTSNLDVPFFVKNPDLGLSLQYGIDSITFYPTFQVVYVPKARATHVRNDRGLSGWYLWQHRAVDNKQIMSLKDLYAYYGFDVAKFFQSDLFQKYLPLFKKQITAAYDSTVQDYINKMGTDNENGYSKRDAMFFSKCVLDSLDKIDDVLKINWEKPDEMKAKLAYNADDTYSLNTKNVKNLDQTSGVDATGTAMETEESENCQEAEEKNADAEVKEDDNEITEADDNGTKSRKLWSKVEAAFKDAAKAYEVLKNYVGMANAAYAHDITFIPDDAPTMPETKADIEKASKAVADLGAAFHFDEA